ncbi:UNVERIFIED_CONTAM: hypothetical protein Scaly_1000800 [Sesamum calycinum]|uniref:Uncharacterized protein n=1 Tax=Sesamum calycinum TaxID=2727403 RepID=A0AAW2QZE4_9LAMI
MNTFFTGPAQTSAGPSGSGPRFRRVAGELQAKKCEIMDRLNESLQEKIDRTGPIAIESIERRTTTTRYMASSGVGEGLELNSAGENPGTPRTLRSNESDDCVGAMDGMLVLAWVPRVEQHRYRSRKGRLAQNILAICEFDMNFTYMYAGWKESAVDTRVLDNAVSQDPNFSFPPIAMAYRRYLESVGFPQEDHWTLNVEQSFMWMILDDNTRAPIRDDARSETQMGYWARRL